MKEQFEFLGVNDDRDVCGCCGKSGLKKVVWLKGTETGAVVAYGVNCAARAMGFGEGYNARNVHKLKERVDARAAFEKKKAKAIELFDKQVAEMPGEKLILAYNPKTKKFNTYRQAHFDRVGMFQKVYKES